MNNKMVMGVALGTVVAVGAVGSLVLKPISEHYVAPLVKEKLNDVINGSANYDSLDVHWNGSVEIKGLHIKDDKGRPVVDAPEVDVQLSAINAIKVGLFDKPGLEAITSLLLKKPHVHLYENKKGEWAISRLVIDKHPEEPFAYRGDVEVEEGLADLVLPEGKTYQIQHINGNVAFDSYPWAKGHATASFAEQTLNLSGQFDMKGQDFKAHIKSDNFELTAFKKFLNDTKNLHIKGGSLAHTDVLIERKGEKLTYRGQTNLKDAHVVMGDYRLDKGNGQILFTGDGIEIKELKGNINGEELQIHSKLKYSHEVIEASEVKVDLAQGKLTGYGWYNLLNHSYEVAGNTKNFDITALGRIMHKDMQGTLTGEFRAKGKNGKLQKARAKVSGSSIAYDGYGVDDFSAALYSDGENFIIPYANGRMDGGIISATGEFGQEQMDMHISGQEVPISFLSKFGNTSGTGTVNLIGHIKGTLTNPIGDFQFGSSGGSLKGIKFSNATGMGHIENHVITLRNTLINAGKGTFRLDGKVGMKAQGPLQLKVSIGHMRAEQLVKPYTDIPITGWLDMQATVEGTLDSPIIQGEAKLREGSIMEQLISDSKIDFTYADENLQIPSFYAKAYGSVIVGSGSMRHKALDFTMTGKHLNLRYVMKDNPYKLDGFVDFKGHIGGNLDRPVFEGNIESDTFMANGTQIKNVSGNLYYDSHIVKVEHFQFEQGKGHILMSGGMDLSKKSLFGQLEIRDGEVGHLIKAFSLPIHNLDGALNAKVKLGGTLDEPNVDMVGQILHTSIKGEEMGTSDIDVHLMHKNININKLRMPIGKGFIAMAGKASINGKANMQIAASKVPIEDLIALSGKKIPVTGTVQGVINILGETKSPTMEMSTTFNNLSYNGTKLDSVFALATLKDGVIRVNQILAKRDSYKATVYGKIPLKAFYADSESTNKDESVDLKVDLNNADLGALPLFIPFIEKGVGPTEGKLHITGPFSDISVNGAIKVKNGKIYVKEVSKPFEQIDGSIIFNGKNAALNLKTVMGTGTATLDGSLIWNDNVIKKYGAQLILNGLDMDSKYYRGKVNGHFEFIQGKKIPTLKGYLNLDNTTIDFPLTLTTSKSSFNTKLDIDVESPNEFRFYNSVLYDMMVTGKVHAGGTLAHPAMSGNVRVKQGTVKYLNNRFKVEEGSAKFDRMDTFLPSLSMKATADVSTYKINLALSGPVEQMKLKVTSDPPLSQQQILSLLTVRTLNVNDGNLGKNALNTLVSTGLQMVVFGSVENVVKEQLHLDKFSITNSYLDPFKLKDVKLQTTNNTLPNLYTLEIGKYVFKDFMVTAGTGLNYNLSRVGVEYRINKHFDLNAWRATDNNYFIGANFKYRF